MATKKILILLSPLTKLIDDTIMGNNYTYSNKKEQGSILVYALVIITFMSGLAAYLQTMSDPMIYESSDTRQILSNEYLASSTSNILSELCQNDPIFKNANVTTLEKSDISDLLNKYKTIQLYRTKTLYIGQSDRKSLIDADNIAAEWLDSNNRYVFTGNVNYYIQHYSTIKASHIFRINIQKTSSADH